MVVAAGNDIDTDEYGRVKVQFHWDRLGKKDEKSSCWVRVSQPLAGKGFGMIALPRIGQEVVVDFLEGDPDRPLVTGRVYNAVQAVPYALPANKTVATLKPRSTLDGAAADFNELRFEDKKGSEYVWLQAEKDFCQRLPGAGPVARRLRARAGQAASRHAGGPAATPPRTASSTAGA